MAFPIDSGDDPISRLPHPPPVVKPPNPIGLPKGDAPEIRKAVVYQVSPTDQSPTECSVLLDGTMPPQPGYSLPAGLAPWYNAGVTSTTINGKTVAVNGPYYCDIALNPPSGGSWVLVNTTTNSVIQLYNGTGSAIPPNAYNIVGTHVHTGGLDGNGNPLPDQVDLTNHTQGALPINKNAPNPARTTPPVLSGSAGAFVYTSAGQSAYDTKSTFTLTTTNPSWLYGLNLYAIVSGGAAPGNSTSVWGCISPASTTGIYTADWYGLTAGVQYDLYVAFQDAAGGVSVPLLIGTTAANAMALATANAFGGTINADGSYSNVDGKSTTTAYTFTAGQTFSCTVDIAKGTTGNAWVILGNTTNGYGLVNDSGGALYLTKYVAGVLTGLGTIAAAGTGGTSYHSLRLSITAVGASNNLIQGTWDGTDPNVAANPGGVTDTSLNLLSGTWPVTLFTGGNTGKAAHFAPSVANPHYVTLPISIKRRVDPVGVLDVSSTPAAVTGTLPMPNHASPVTNTLDTAAGADGSFLKTGMITRRHQSGFGTGGNLLFNPSAALNTTGWTNVNGTNSGNTRDNYLGGRFIITNTNAGTLTDGQYTQTVSLGSDPVSVSGIVELAGTVNLAAGVGARVELYDSTTSTVIGNSTGLTVSASGSRVFFTFTATPTPGHTTLIRLRLGAGSGVAYFYRVKCEVAPQSSAFTDDTSANLVTGTHDPNGGSGIDGLIDGATYGRLRLTALTSGTLDLSKSGVVNKVLTNIADDGTYSKTVASAITSGKPNKITDGTTDIPGSAVTGTLQSTINGPSYLKSSVVDLSTHTNATRLPQAKHHTNLDNAITLASVDSTGKIDVSQPSTGKILPRPNHHGDFTTTVKSGGGVATSQVDGAAIQANVVDLVTHTTATRLPQSKHDLAVLQDSVTGTGKNIVPDSDFRWASFLEVVPFASLVTPTKITAMVTTNALPTAVQPYARCIKYDYGTTGTSGTYVGFSSGLFPMVVGKTYTLSFALSDNISSAANILIGFADASGSMYGFSSRTSTTNGQVTYTYTPTTGQTQGRVQIMYNGAVPSSGNFTFYIAGLQVEVGSVATSYKSNEFDHIANTLPFVAHSTPVTATLQSTLNGPSYLKNAVVDLSSHTNATRLPQTKHHANIDAAIGTVSIDSSGKIDVSQPSTGKTLPYANHDPSSVGVLMDSAGNVKGSGPLKLKVPNLAVSYANVIFNVACTGTTTVTVKVWITNNGVGGTAGPKWTMGDGATYTTPTGSTAVTGAATGSGTDSTNLLFSNSYSSGTQLWFIIVWTPTSSTTGSWTCTAYTSRPTDAQVAAAFADGGLLAVNASASATGSVTAAGGFSGSGSGGGGHVPPL